MAGGPITLQCAEYGYRFNRKGEHLVRYDFTKWGYGMLDLATEATATRLDSDSAYRAADIKAHHIKPYVKPIGSDNNIVAGYPNGRTLTCAQLREMCATTPHDSMCCERPTCRSCAVRRWRLS
jgi:hypothetical protein